MIQLKHEVHISTSCLETCYSIKSIGHGSWLRWGLKLLKIFFGKINFVIILWLSYILLQLNLDEIIVCN